MRILWLSFVLALPMATIASANDTAPSTLGGDLDPGPQTAWRVGPTVAGRIVTTAHVYL